MNTPLQLNDYSVEKIYFEAFDQEDKLAEQNKLSIHSEVSWSTPTQAIITLVVGVNTIESLKGKMPYSVELTLKGLYAVDEKLTQEDKERLTGPIGITNLYGIARGVLGQITGISKYGKLVLPNFNVMSLKAEKTETEAKKPKPRKPKKRSNP